MTGRQRTAGAEQPEPAETLEQTVARLELEKRHMELLLETAVLRKRVAGLPEQGRKEF